MSADPLCRLIDLVAEDNAIEDTIYHLARALDAERIDLDRFLKASLTYIPRAHALTTFLVANPCVGTGTVSEAGVDRKDNDGASWEMRLAVPLIVRTYQAYMDTCLSSQCVDAQQASSGSVDVDAWNPPCVRLSCRYGRRIPTQEWALVSLWIIDAQLFRILGFSSPVCTSSVQHPAAALYTIMT